MTPEAIDLLEEAVSILRNGLANTLSGESRYLALLTANAVDTARRESVVEAVLDDAREALSGFSITAIRSGALDSDAVLYERALTHAALRAWVADPDGLSQAERQQYLRGMQT